MQSVPATEAARAIANRMLPRVRTAHIEICLLDVDGGVSYVGAADEMGTKK